MKKKFESILLYDSLSKEEYQSIKNDLKEQNRKNLFAYCIIVFFAFVVLTGVSFVFQTISINRGAYCIVAAVVLLLAVLLDTAAKRKRWVGDAIMYFFNSSLCLFAAYIGTVTGPTESATAFCVIICMLPFLTYEPVLFAVLHRAVMCIIFFALACRYKDMEIVGLDVINIVAYGSLSTVIGIFRQSVEASAYYLRRNMKREIRVRTKQIEELSIQSISALASAIDAKDAYTNGHSLRVAQYSKMIAQRMGKTEEEQENIYYIALLHDVGKIGIPDRIINKAHALDDEEFAIVKSHPMIGYEILKKIEGLPDIALGARYHHERFDGRGYPDGLAGNEIPEIARIIAVADTYDAMASKRSYRPRMPQAQVRAELEKCRNAQLDGSIVEIMLAIIDEDTEYQYSEA